MAGDATRVRVYQPRLQVLLYKQIERTTLDGKTPVSKRFTGTKRVIDLTPLLGEGSTISTTKSLSDPAGGFTLRFVDKAVKSTGASSSIQAMESLYGLVEPMDVITIRARHDVPAPGTSAGTKPPLIMRGFVSNVGRSETMGPDGTPQRAVVVSGQDFGKLWQQLVIMYLPGYLLGEDIITDFQLFTRFGVGFGNTTTGGDFVTQVTDKILTPYLRDLSPANSPIPTTFSLDIKVKHGTTSVFGPQNEEGAVYNLMAKYLDVGPWNELFIEDREEGVYVVYRPNPYLDIDGKTLIQMDPSAPDAVMPEIVDVPDQEIMAIELNRGDGNLANYYWVNAPRFDLVDDMTQRLFAISGATRDTVLLDTYQNTALKLYGQRPMFSATQMGGDDVATFASGQDAPGQAKRQTDMANWITARRRVLVLMNRDNVLLESGVIRARGRPEYKAGRYARVRRGSMRALHYIRAVDHQITAFGNWVTTLQLSRGMGFVERVKREGGRASPYLAELTRTPALPPEGQP